MKSKLIYFLIILLFTTICSAQINPGSKQISLCHSDVALADDVFSIFNNPAGLKLTKRREIGFFYSPSPFGVKELASSSFAYHEPLNIGSFGLGIMKYGFELLNEYKFVFSYSNIIAEKLYLGFSTFFHLLRIKNYGETSVFSLTLGGIFFVNRDISLGFSIFNPFRASYGNTENQLPVSISTGFSYRIFQVLILNLSLFQELDFPPSIRTGIEFLPIEYISLRIGLNDYPETVSGGIGLLYSIFQIDYALSADLILGLTHQLGIILNLGGNF